MNDSSVLLVLCVTLSALCTVTYCLLTWRSPRLSPFFFFLMIRRPPRSTLDRSSAASDVYKRQPLRGLVRGYADFKLPDESAGARKGDYECHDKRLTCLLYTSPSPRDRTRSRMPSSA